jgi:mono/diheme cytochrome c family protein
MSRLLTVCLLAGLTAGCGKPDPAQRYQTPEEVRDFTQLYDQNCRGCHGTDGRMGPAPPLNDPLFLAMIEDGDLRMIISQGRKDTLMPAFGGLPTDVLVKIQKRPVIGTGILTDAQVEVLVKDLRFRWGKPDEVGSGPLPKYLSGKELEDQLATADKARGKKLFALACATCHGDAGLGTKKAGAVNQPAFLKLMSNQVLRRLIITGRPDLGMPDFRDSNGRAPEFQPLNEQDIADLTALLVSWRERDSTAQAKDSQD